jgi:aspartyl-tRNA(Asn)/glutamyl-tRNA(Gln) amidotransferase subunit A
VIDKECENTHRTITMPFSVHALRTADAALWREDAVGQSALLDAGKITPLQLLEMYLERCDRMGPVLNAFTLLDRAGAATAAAAATDRQKVGRRLGPLDGIPVAIKDNLHVVGLPAEWGSLMLKGFVPERDDICVERLRAKGAIIIGKTTTPEFALSGRTENRATGTTRNPWDPRLTPGGSSGGAVAAVAAGMVPLAIGTDAGGSTRMPASYTGLVGLRPSNGRVPRRYGFPPMALDFQAIGLITRTMRDLELLFSAVAGPDVRDPISLSVTPPRRHAKPRRLGWFTSIGAESASAQVVASHGEALRQLEHLGYMVEPCAAPFDLEEIRGIWDTITSVGAARAAGRFGESWKTLATKQIAELVERGLRVPATTYVNALDRLQTFRAETSARWGDFDALVLPANPVPAWPVETDHPTEIDGRPLTLGAQGMFCGWVNAMGYAGMSVPGRPSVDGRPIGIQVVAPAGADEVLVEIGRGLEEVSPWKDRWPPLATS